MTRQQMIDKSIVDRRARITREAERYMDKEIDDHVPPARKKPRKKPGDASQN